MKTGITFSLQFGHCCYKYTDTGNQSSRTQVQFVSNKKCIPSSNKHLPNGNIMKRKLEQKQPVILLGKVAQGVGGK